ncbi:MAG TPA: RNA polymerase sigma factor [Anaerolineales bacterium]|nr:RNA polymerase sigma factor [Anaerolineales bacterium]
MTTHVETSPLSLHGQETCLPTLETLIRDHYSYIQRLALTILDDGSPDAAVNAQAEAEDAAQDTFLAASRALPDFRGNASLKTWLTTIAVNQCRARLRKRKTHRRLQKLISNQQSAIKNNPPSPEDSTLESDTHRHLWAAVDSLDEKHRLPVLMRYVHELPIPEIAAALGLPEGTVHSRLHHARARLQARLTEETHE